MNLDDFIVPTSMASPAGVSPLPINITEDSRSSTATTAAAMPIKPKQRSFEEEFQLSRASAPTHAPLGQNRASEEFAYVQRRVRKTSIDESRVCIGRTSKVCRR